MLRKSSHSFQTILYRRLQCLTNFMLFSYRYLIVKEDKTLENYGLNAVCTHLGCVVPWSAATNKFMCPCHGSQYAPDGSVVRGPAPLPLALAHCEVSEDDNILFSPWVEDDFRTGGKGWWN
jgi:cytochrome b6-f complex iron-sulfur subunit